MSEKVISEREAVLRERAAAKRVLGYFNVYFPTPEGAKNRDEFVVNQFPLPKVKRPRVVADPHPDGKGQEFKSEGGEVFYRCFRNTWHKLHISSTFGISPARIRVWYDLLENPTEDVDDDGFDAEKP